MRHRVEWMNNGRRLAVWLELGTEAEIVSGVEEIRDAGLGDTIERGIQRLTRGKVKPCEGCKKRRDALNRLMPYRGDDGD